METCLMALGVQELDLYQKKAIQAFKKLAPYLTPKLLLQNNLQSLHK